MSNHSVEVVRVGLLPHPNADTLSIVKVYGFECAVKTEQFKGVNLAGYIVPDSVVDTRREEFSFLASEAKADGTYRVRARRYCQIWSMGLLIPAKPHWKEGKDVAAELGVTHYEPPEQGGGGANKGKKSYIVPIPKVNGIPIPEYTEIENWRKYNNAFLDGELVIATEKLHGCNSRYCYSNDKLHSGSHHGWKSAYLMARANGRLSFRAWRHHPIETLKFLFEYLKLKFGKPMEVPADQLDNWCKVAKLYNLEEKLKQYPDMEFFGEIYGASVQKGYTYDTTSDEPLKIRFFDIYDVKKGRYLNYNEASNIFDKLELPKVPLLYVGPWNETLLKELVEGKEPLSNGKHPMEGTVIRPHEERYDRKLGRVILKLISNNYLAKDKS